MVTEHATKHEHAFPHVSRHEGQVTGGLVIAPSVLLAFVYVFLLGVVLLAMRVVHLGPLTMWAQEGVAGLSLAGVGIVVGLLLLGYLAADFWRFQSRGLAWRFPHVVAFPGAAVLLVAFVYFLSLTLS